MLAGEENDPPIKALYVYNSNPAAVAPNQTKVIEGLKREDLFVVAHEQVATDTVDYADIVLPATTQLEHGDIHSAYGHHFVMLNTPAIAPIGEARSNNDVFRALAARLDFEAELFPDDETLIRECLDGGKTVEGITLERLRETPSIRLNLDHDPAPFAEGHFPTPSGKCELYSEQMKLDGFDPLPTYTPSHEDPREPKTGRAVPAPTLESAQAQFLNSTFAGSPSHRATAADPTIELSKEDAEERNVIEAQWVEVFNDRGRFLACASLSGNVCAGVAVALGIHWNKLVPGRANVNATVSDALADMGGGATFFDNLVEVRPWNGSIELLEQSPLNKVNGKHS